MLSILGSRVRLCDGITRREALRVGGLGFTGLGGQVDGSSDGVAAYPSTNPVSPADIAATIFHCLGIDPRSEMTDQQGRPIIACPGTPVAALVG